MPFPQADIYSSSLSHGLVVDEQRLERISSKPLPRYKRINSTQFFVVALLLFVATGVQAYFNTTPTSLESFQHQDVILRNLSLAIDEFLSPLMILACTVTMAGALCRGLELVIHATAFKGK